MKKMMKYGAVIFALILATSIIGGCLTAGVAVIRMIVETTSLDTDGERNENADRDNSLWHEDENGNIIFMGMQFGGNQNVKSGTQEFAAEKVHSMDIESLSSELVIEPWDSDYISVDYENIAEEYEIYMDGGVLKIRCDQDWFVFGISVNGPSRIRVQVPADKVWENIVVDTGSGSMAMTRLEAENVEVDSGSGSVRMLEVNSEELYVDSGSGSVNIAQSSMKECKVSSGSGSIKLTEVISEKAVLDNGSGSVTVKDSTLGETLTDTGSGSINFEEVTAEDLKVESGSGRVNFLGELYGNCEFDTSSGSINLEIYGEEENYNIRTDLGSGGLYINGAKERDTDIKHSGADHLLVFDTGSGRVSIEFLGSREIEQEAGSGRAGK